MGAIVLCCLIMLYLLCCTLVYTSKTVYSLKQSFCILFGLCGYGFYYSFVFMPFHALVFQITSQLIINKLGFGSGALWLSGCRSFLLSFLHLGLSELDLWGNPVFNSALTLLSFNFWLLWNCGTE